MVADGDIEALRKLDDEERELGPELEVLRDLYGRLRLRLDEQRAKAYVDNMPQTFAGLRDSLAAQAAAQAAARKAAQTVAEQMKELQQQRHHITRQVAINGQKLVPPPAELLAQYMKVQGYTYHRGPDRVGWFSPTSGSHELNRVAEVLGVDVPRPEQQAA